MDRPYNKSAHDILKDFSVDAESGLSPDQVRSSRDKHGANIQAIENKSSGFRIFFRQFKNSVILVLMTAAGISLAIGDVKEFFVILIIILFTVLIGFIEEFKADKDMQAIMKLSPRKARIVRGSRIQILPAHEIVPGDIVVLERGDVVPADGRVISQSDLRIDESLLTGESYPASKSDAALKGEVPASGQSNMVFSGTHVTSGHCRFIVIRTGFDTEIGKISKAMSRIKETDTPLQNRIDRLGRQFSVIIFVLCCTILATGLLRGQSFEMLLMLTVAVAVSGIPESLPAVIAVALSVGLKRMAKQNALIKKMTAVETLGSCSVICSDKTGTLTQNRMVIEKIFTLDAEVAVTGDGFTPEGLFMKETEQIDPRKHGSISKVIEIGTLCNNAELVKQGTEWGIDGETTEGALIVMAQKAGVDRKSMHKDFPRIHEHPFDPVRKCMSSVHMIKDMPIVYAKGAPEYILRKSTQCLSSGRIRRLDQKTIRILENKVDQYAALGMRVLALAYKEHRGRTYEVHRVESSLIFVGLVAMRDPPVPAAVESVKQCKEAGTKVVMITGDNRLTAISVARELGIYSDADDVLTGEELDKIDDNEFLRRVDHISVYARTTPFQKLRIIESLQKKGHVVAMTGDGVNDAPALKRADIGIAMGRRGTEVAKESADMVILDDNFSTIVTAIKEGRTIYMNLRKFIYFLIVGNFSEVMLIVMAGLLGIIPPLAPIMILFINIVTSDIPAIGLCLEKPPASIMKQKPRNPKEGLLNYYMLLKIGHVMAIVVLGTLSLFFWEIVIKKGSFPRAQTIAFATLICFELFHVFNAKSFHESIFSSKIFNNPSLIVGIMISIVMMLFAIYFPPMQDLLHTVPLEPLDWVSIVFVSSMVLMFIEIEKAIISSELEEIEKEAIHL